MSCNIISNPSFEAGLTGWHTTPLDIATVVTSDVAYDGSNFVYGPIPPHYLYLHHLTASPSSLQTTPDAPTANVHTYLYDLDTTASYNLTVQMRVEGDLPSVNQCTFSVEAGDDPAAGTIASDFVWTTGEWIQLNGTYEPSVVDTVFNLVATCSFSGDVTLLNAYFDDIVLGDC
ncbi:hypothetical protein BJX99DRAFT_258690 [Aspergillus californicus]